MCNKQRWWHGDIVSLNWSPKVLLLYSVASTQCYERLQIPQISIVEKNKSLIYSINWERRLHVTLPSARQVILQWWVGNLSLTVARPFFGIAVKFFKALYLVCLIIICSFLCCFILNKLKVFWIVLPQAHLHISTQDNTSTGSHSGKSVAQAVAVRKQPTNRWLIVRSCVTTTWSGSY